MDDDQRIHVAVIGGGLVGALEASLLARRGYRVTIFESRHDGRNEPNYYGRSINLAISYRGIRALKLLDLDYLVKDHSIPMGSRMIHDLKGKQTAIPYDPHGRCINSIERAGLNTQLLNTAERDYGVTIKFNHKLVDMQPKKGELSFLIRSSNDNDSPGDQLVKYKVDLIFGCDGARSSVRGLMARSSQVEMSQSFIDHVYLELRIDPMDSDGDFRMAPNHLHIWPRGKFMMIALPNKDKTFTCTLFIPKTIIEEICEPKKALQFFEQHFPDSVPLIGAERIMDTLSNVRSSPLISITCNPYNQGGRVVLLGDAAHAMVPFYGQGMNCGFEDCLVLDELLGEVGLTKHKSLLERDQFDSNLYEQIFDKYSTIRVANGQAMVQVAMYNHIEMRDLVNTWSFKCRKIFDAQMYRLFPKYWIPLYTMITFTHLPVDECVRLRAKQDKILSVARKLGLGLLTGSAIIAILFHLNKRS